MSSVIYNPFLYAWLNENFRKEFKQILPCLFVNISTHRELKNPKTFLSSLSRKKHDDNLIRNGEKTQAETTFLQANHENIIINIETEINNGEANHNGVNNDSDFKGNSNNHSNDKNNLIARNYDEMVSSSTSRTQETSES